MEIYKVVGKIHVFLTYFGKIAQKTKKNEKFFCRFINFVYICTCISKTTLTLND